MKRLMVVCLALSSLAMAQTTVFGATPNAVDNLTVSGTLAVGTTVANGNYSAVTLPSDFPATGITFSRDGNGNYTSSFDPDAYATSWNITKTLYVNYASGNDTTGDGSSGTPYKTPGKAFVAAAALADTAIKIVVVTGGANVVLPRAVYWQTGNFAINGKRIYLTPDDTTKKVYATSYYPGLSWSLSSGKTYTFQANRTNVRSVLDMTSLDAYGIPKAYSYQTSVANVEATAGSWYTDGTVVYVHTLAGTVPVDGTHLVQVNTVVFKADITNSGELFVRNHFFVASPDEGEFYVSGDYSVNKVVAYNCAFAYADSKNLNASNGDGFKTDGIKAVQVYSSVAAYNAADGFSGHISNAYTNQPATVRQYYSLFVNATSFNNGLGNADNIENGFTSHEGMNVACVGCLGYNTKGPVYAFVNGSNSVIIGSKSFNSAHGGTTTSHTTYWFDNTSAPAGTTGKVYIEDSVGSDSLYDLASDGNVPITLRNFRGSKIPLATYQQVTEVGWFNKGAFGARLVAVPASASAACVPGDYALASGFRYDCITPNVWQRVALATW